MKKALAGFLGLLLLIMVSALLGVSVIPYGQEIFAPMMNVNQELAGPIIGCFTAAGVCGLGALALMRFVDNPLFPEDER